MPSPLRLLPLVCALALLPAGAAHAALSISVIDGTTIYVSDVDDTVNTATITRAGGTVTIRDTSTNPTINSSPECMTSVDDPSAVVCTVADPVLESVYAGGGNDTVTLDGISGKNVLGAAGDDTLTGSALGDLLDGNENNDKLVGGGGADQMIGRDGDDRIEARDDVADVGVDCGEGAADVAVTDASDPHAAGCETDDRGTTGGGGGGGTPATDTDSDGIADSADNCPADANADQHDADGDAKGDACDLVVTKVSVKVPNAKPRKKSGKWRFVSIDSLRKAVERLKVPFRVTARPVALGGIKQQYRKTVDDGDITAQAGSPEPGSRVTIDTACADPSKSGCRLNLRVNVYDESLELKGRRCPYKNNKLTRLLEGQTYAKALAILSEQDCDFRIVNYVESKSDPEERIYDAQFSKTDNRFFINLVVQRPVRSDFTVSLAPRPFSDYGIQNRVAEFERELDLGTDGKLTSARDNNGVLHVIVNENFSSRFIKSVRIELVRNPAGSPGQAKAIASSETGDAGAVTFSIGTDWVGDLEVSVRVKAKRTKDDLVEDTMRGWVTVPVVKRGTSRLLVTRSGRAFRFEDGRWQRVDLFTEAMQGFADALKSLNDSFGPGAACRGQEGDTNTQRFVNSCWRDGLAVTATSNGGTSVGTGSAGFQTLPGFVVRRGSLAQASVPAAIVPDDRAVFGVAVQGSAADTLLGQARSPLALLPGTTVEGGIALVSDGGSGLLGKIAGVPLVGPDGGSLVGPDGGTLIGLDGASLISDKGVGILPVGLIGPDGGT